jgi:AraC-like DNA-binding protein
MAKENIPTLDFNDESNTTLPFSIQLIKGLKDVRHEADHSAHRHNFHILSFIKSGNGIGINTIDFVDHSAGPHSVLIIRANQVHAFMKIKATQFEAIVITFPQEFIYPLTPLILEDSENINKIIPPKKDFDYLYDLLLKVYTEYHSNNKWRGEIIKNYINIILTHLSRIYLNQNPAKNTHSSGDALISKYKKLINEHYLKFHRVSDYAKMLFLSAGHLNDKIKELTGRTTKELINERIILEAKRLLLYNEWNVKEIADSLNFKDFAYFNRFFRNQTGQTPKDFRIQIRKNYQ